MRVAPMAEERRYGRPRTDVERQLRHYERTGELLPIHLLPPRGTGFRTWKAQSSQPRPLSQQSTQSSITPRPLKELQPQTPSTPSPAPKPLKELRR